MTTSFITDDIAIEIERYLKTAVEVCIAAAFVNIKGVELFKKFMEKTRETRPYNIYFLLDKDFHNHPAARDAIIKELCSIPGAKVRVFNDPEQRLHMKVYIFSSGNTVNVIAGSHNPTGAGLTKNIEASLLTSNKKAIREARNYFNKYWSSSEEVIPNPEAYYREPLFQPGQMVRQKETNKTGIVMGLPNPPDLRGKIWFYKVLFFSDATTTECPESDLQSTTLIQVESGDTVKKLIDSFNGDADEYLRGMLRKKMLTPSRDNLFSYMSSRTDIIPFQFKPLLKILSSEMYRILIADEVGLGKTIEAGIIFTELKARMPKLHRALVICPTNLKTKWKDEMESRFDEYFQILSKDSFLKTLQNRNLNCFGIISYELIGNDEIIEILKDSNSNWDLLIIDEAHHLRNKNKRHIAVAQIARQATAQVMLSATPINLGLNDLKRILQILLPSEYRDLDEVEFAHRLDPNKYLFEAAALVEQEPAKALNALELMEKQCKYADKIIAEPGYQQIKALLTEKSLFTISEIVNIKEELNSINVLTNIITRTRKEDVGLGKPREIITFAVEYSDFEKSIYSEMIDLSRMLAKKNKKKRGSSGGSLAAIMPQRQAASCLWAAIEYLRDMVYKNSISVHEGSGELEELDEDEPAEVPVNDESVISKARTLIKRYDSNKRNYIDTKYSKLLEFLKTRAMVDGKLDKVIVFTGFRKTLVYLKEKIENDFGPGSVIEVHGDIPLLERDDRRKLFQKENGPSVFISTEIGSEGLDMQFANKLVNYDLPWNPMRVEQRIGRIDRIGQKADKLMVLNFAITDTIEDNIIVRLIERVKVFNNSLGELSSVLGTLVTQLRDDLLNPNLTDEQRQINLHKLEQSLERKARADAKLREQRDKLMGQDNTFTEDMRGIQQNQRYVTSQEILRVVQLFASQYPNEVFYHEVTPGTYQFKISGKPMQLLRSKIKSLHNINDFKRKKYIQIISEGNFYFTADRKIATEEKQLEFFTINNPIISSIVISWKDPGKTVVGYFEGELQDIPSGIYMLFTYYCEYERPHLSKSVYFYNVAVEINKGLITSYGDKLYHEIIGGSIKLHDSPDEISQEVIENAREVVFERIEKMVGDTAAKLDNERKHTLQKEVKALKTSLENEISILTQRRKSAGDNRVRDQIEKQIQDKKDQVQSMVEEILNNIGDVIAKPEHVGLAVCSVKKGGTNRD